MRKLLLLAGGLIVVLLTVVLAVLLMLDPDDFRDEIAERASLTLGREVRLEGPINLRLFPWLALEIEDVAIGNPADFGEAPMLARIGSASAALRLWPLVRGELEVGAVTLRDGHFAVVTNRAGETNLEGLLGTGPTDPATEAAVDLSALSTGPVQLERVVLEVFDVASGDRTLVRLERLELDAFRAGQAVPLRMQGSLSDGETLQVDALQFQGRLRVAVDLAWLAVEDWRASLELPAAEARVRAEGSLRLQLDEPSPVLLLQQLTTHMNVADQEIGLELRQPLRLVLDAVPAARLADARITLNGQTLGLTGSVTLADPLTAELAVSGDRLDLRPLIQASEGAAAQTRGRPADDAPDFSALIGPRLVFDLDLDELIVDDKLRLSTVNAQARLLDGLLQIDPLQAGLLGGNFAGRISVDFNAVPPRTRISPELSGIEAGQVAGLVSEVAPLRGLGDLTLDLNFAGLGLADILSSLDGEGSFRLDEGALLGVDLRRLIEEKLTVSTLGNVNQAFGGETPFRSLTGSVRAESGVIFLPDLNLSAADFGASGQGQLDFAAGQVAYRLDLRLGEALIERLPRQLARATGGVIPLAIAGPLTRPVVQVDLAAIAEGAVQRELQDRLLDRLRPPPAQDETDAENDQEAAPERRERTSDLLRRALRERQEREPEPPPGPLAAG